MPAYVWQTILNGPNAPRQLMVKKTRKGISVASAQFTATVSVTLVLVMLGAIAMIGVATRSVTRGIQESMGFNIILADSLSEQRINELKQYCAEAYFVASQRYVSSDDALAEWREQTGEDLMEILEVNPFSSEIEVKVKARYANPDSLAKLTIPIKAMDGVADITMPTGLIESISRSLNSLAIVLTLIAVALLLISFVLINNTVHLAVYAKRFSIHTMKLVGATAGFIRRPFIYSNVICGLIAGIVADILLSTALSYLQSLDQDVAAALPWSTMWVILLATPLAGVIITGAAALFSTNKYLNKSYDDMFR